MRIYISGISGTGMGPLALMAKNAGLEVFGSDLSKGAIYDELIAAGIEVKIGSQDGKFLEEKMKDGVDWFVHTSALPEDHAELVMAKKAGIKVTKRDDLTAYLVDKLNLKMVAVAGTHGKTTTTAMIVWVALKLGLPVAYIVGTTLGFAASGAYKDGDEFFIYEADEYDRNFLKFHPWLSVIVSVSYDHPDIYPDQDDYKKAFLQFEGQSKKVIENENDNSKDLSDGLKLAGRVRRADAGLAIAAVKEMVFSEIEGGAEGLTYDEDTIINIVNKFPGVGRRFEKIADGVYTDYAHHPEEIAATVEIALEEVKLKKKKGVVVVYQPHQNTRQHEVREGYKDAFSSVQKIFWLPTYLTREDPRLKTLMPEELIAGLSNKEVAESAEIDEELKKKLDNYLKQGYLILLMTAGPADEWWREKFGIR